MMYAEDKGLASLKRQYKIISPRQRPRHTPPKELELELELELPIPGHESIPRDYDVEAQRQEKEAFEVIINLNDEPDPCVIRNAF
jgi:hypothetical protein